MCHLGFPKFWFGFRRNSLLEQMLFGILPFDVYSRCLGKLISSTVHKSFDPFILVGGRLNNARGSKNQSYNLLQALMFGWRRSRTRNWTETEINSGSEIRKRKFRRGPKLESFQSFWFRDNFCRNKSLRFWFMHGWRVRCSKRGSTYCHLHILCYSNKTKVTCFVIDLGVT